MGDAFGCASTLMLSCLSLTLGQMAGAFPDWDIFDSAGGGWYAIRRMLMPPPNGLSNVRCGATLEELKSHLESEARLQAIPRPRA